MKLKTFILVILCLAISACMSHYHTYGRGDDIGALTKHRLSGKKIAFDFSQVPAEHYQSANGHRYHITGIRDSAEAIGRKMFKNDRIVESSSKADVVLVFKLATNMGATFGGTSCTSDAIWEIRKPTGKLLAKGQASGQSSIPTMGVGGQNCEISFLDAMGKALDDAMNKL